MLFTFDASFGNPFGDRLDQKSWAGVIRRLQSDHTSTPLTKLVGELVDPSLDRRVETISKQNPTNNKKYQTQKHQYQKKKHQDHQEQNYTKKQNKKEQKIANIKKTPCKNASRAKINPRAKIHKYQKSTKTTKNKNTQLAKMHQYQKNTNNKKHQKQNGPRAQIHQ